MSFNFSQLQQSVDRLLINSSEAINKLVDLTIAPARDVTVQYYDRNGNLVTQTTPNMMKVLNTVQTNINSYMQKTVYVDQVNGNDNNDGTQTRPFKTLQKAFDSVPVGGEVVINLLSDIDLNNVIRATNKRVVVVGSGIKRTIKSYYGKAGNFNTVLGKILASGCTIAFHNVIIEMLESPNLPLDPSLPTDSSAQFLAKRDNAGINICSFFNCDIIIRRYPFAWAGHDAAFNSYFLLFYYTNIQRPDNNGSLLYGHFHVLIVNQGNTLPPNTHWRDLIAGIARDINGVPRNVISNVIL